MVHGSEYEALSDRSVASLIQTGTDAEEARASASAPSSGPCTRPQHQPAPTSVLLCVLHSTGQTTKIKSDTTPSHHSLHCSRLEVEMEDFCCQKQQI